MAANWSTSAWTVEASRVRMRSTPELARLLAMAVPLDVNSSVRLPRSARTAVNQVMPARGTSTATRKRMIFASRLKRAWDPIGGPPAGSRSSGTRVASSVMARLPFELPPACLGLERGRPVDDGHPPVALDASEIDIVQTLVPLATEAQGRADPD